MNFTNWRHLLRRCATLRQLQQAHAQSITQGLHLRLQPLACKIFNSYAALTATSDAHKVFLTIPSPDLVSLTSLMSLHLQTGHPRQAAFLFRDIIASGHPPDSFAAVGALSAAGRIGDLGLGASVHALIYRRHLHYDNVAGNALVDMYCRNGRLERARKVFDEMPVRNSVSCSTLLHGHVKCEGLDSARHLFAQMPHRDTVLWTVMITGHVQGKQPVRALELFRQMKAGGHSPTLITIVAVLSACSDIGALDLGLAIHGYINKTIARPDVTVSNALIDMYSKSGKLEMADEVFVRVVHKDVYTWTTMIYGLAVNGSGRRAMDVFLEMLSSSVNPNEVTMVAVLSACSHGGLVREGRALFDRMRRVYKVEPRLEHYGCMVDLLGRAGMLREATQLIEEMGTEPDAVIWRSVLSACLVHGDMDLAEMAGKEIIKMEPDDDGVHVLLWNMYASSKRWGDALEIRRKMRERKVVKKRGCSWIEMNGVVHEFLVEDKLHPSRREIYLVLKQMAKHLEDGYIYH